MTVPTPQSLPAAPQSMPLVRRLAATRVASFRKTWTPAPVAS